MPRAPDMGLPPATLLGREVCGMGVVGEGGKGLNPPLQRIKPCPELLRLCQPRERKPPPAAAAWGRGEGFVKVAVC